MDKLFLQILNMSLTGGYVILFVLAARVILKKAPKIFSYVMWGVVLFRLVCPISVGNLFSLVAIREEPFTRDMAASQVPQLDSGISLLDDAVNRILPVTQSAGSSSPLQMWLGIGMLIWIVGMFILLGYSAVSIFILRRKLVGAVRQGGNIYLADGLESSFVMGIVRPRIYMPSILSEKERRYILLHEQTHIKRCDHLVKIAAFCVLCVHWFNPLVWIAFFLMGKDMEMACDEKVMRRIGADTRGDYAAVLFNLAVRRRGIAGLPLAFNEGDTKGRIKNILHYKKPTVWIVAGAAVIVAILCLGLAGNRKAEVRPAEEIAKKSSVASDTMIISKEKEQAVFSDLIDLMMDTFTKNGINKIENYAIIFSDETLKDGIVTIDIALLMDWTIIRKPTGHPLIKGMERAYLELVTDEEKEAGRSYINGFLAEMEPEYNVLERIPLYFKMKFAEEDKNNLTYELFYPMVYREEEGMLPAKEHFESIKERPEEKEQMGYDMMMESVRPSE